MTNENNVEQNCKNCRYYDTNHCSGWELCSDWEKSLKQDETWPTWDDMRRKRYGEIKNRGKGYD